MGCTHSKNSKSKVQKKSEQPLERTAQTAAHHSRVAHFDETQPTTPSTSVESEEPLPTTNYTKNLLNETKESKIHEKSSKKPEPIVDATVKPHADPPADKQESAPQTAVPLTSKQYVASTYYPMPTEKHKSPEKKKPKKVEEKKKKEVAREKIATGPIYRPQLTPSDLENIKRSVQQRNERRAYMMAHRNETDDTLYELEVRMPERDYTNRIEATQQQNYRVY